MLKNKRTNKYNINIFVINYKFTFENYIKTKEGTQNEIY